MEKENTKIRFLCLHPSLAAPCFVRKRLVFGKHAGNLVVRYGVKAIAVASVRSCAYRNIADSSSDHAAIIRIRGDKLEAIRGVEWVGFDPSIYNNVIPMYTNIDRVPKYLSNVMEDLDTGNYYRCCRMLGAMADPHFSSCIGDVEHFQEETSAKSHALLNAYDAKMTERQAFGLCEEANEAICAMFRKSMSEVPGKVLLTTSKEMKNALEVFDTKRIPEQLLNSDACYFNDRETARPAVLFYRRFVQLMTKMVDENPDWPLISFMGP